MINCALQMPRDCSYVTCVIVEISYCHYLYILTDYITYFSVHEFFMPSP
jgi:hypothetical protein